MEYIRGQDVRTILKTEHRAGRAVPWGCARAIARGIAAGLHYAHERAAPDGRKLNIIHRDISPDNEQGVAIVRRWLGDAGRYGKV